MNIIPQNDYDASEILSTISRFFKQFDIVKKLKQSNCKKAKGISAVEVLKYLFTLVFKGRSMYMDQRLSSSEAGFSDDTAYRLLNDGRINWNHLISSTAADIANQVILPADSDDRVKAFVVDDSVISRNRSKNVELLTKVFDHAHHIFLNGFRMLTIGWTDGESFLPLAASLLSSENPDTRIKEARPFNKRSNAYKRRELSMTKGTDAMITLLKTAKASGIPADYVLFDSWFTSPKTIFAIKNLGYDVIGMVKKSPKMTFEYDGQMMPLTEIYKKNKKRRGRSKYLLSVTVNVVKDREKIPARVVYVRNRSNRREYLCLISTNTDIDENEIIRIYGKRWKIEVFFKICKSYLNLVSPSECRAISYDAMTAHMSIVFMRYMMLAVEQRKSKDQRTLGELFLYFVDEIADISFAEALSLLTKLFREEMKDYFDLDEAEIDRMIDKFITALRPAMRRQLSAA